MLMRSATAKSVFDARSAGINPKSTAVRMQTPSENKSTGGASAESAGK
jgi:hypothetical protein